MTSNAQRIASLRGLGFRIRTSREYHQQVSNFQRGWNLGPRLAVDGDPGPKFDAALEESISRKAHGEATASENFSFVEFRCKCGGKYRSCQRIWVLRELIQTLEEVRDDFYPDGLVPVSGCRCTDHNRAVGGASSSQHMYGGACDITPKVPRRKLAAKSLAAGIGFNASSGLVAHIDRRDRSGHNTTGASPIRPTMWIYHR